MLFISIVVVGLTISNSSTVLHSCICFARCSILLVFCYQTSSSRHFCILVVGWHCCLNKDLQLECTSGILISIWFLLVSISLRFVKSSLSLIWGICCLLLMILDVLFTVWCGYFSWLILHNKTQETTLLRTWQQSWFICINLHPHQCFASVIYRYVYSVPFAVDSRFMLLPPYVLSAVKLKILLSSSLLEFSIIGSVQLLILCYIHIVWHGMNTVAHFISTFCDPQLLICCSWKLYGANVLLPARLIFWPLLIYFFSLNDVLALWNTCLNRSVNFEDDAVGNLVSLKCRTRFCAVSQ